jgi:pSer/pThr/pTyr-binding forkhead associated (FHA) protein
MERSSEDTPVLVGQTGPLNGQRWMLRDKLIIGRDSLCEIIIPSRQVSRQHAKFTTSAQGVILEDLLSKNGTHLNGKLIENPMILKDGDVVQIALAQQFVFLSSDATLPLELFESLEVQPTTPGRLRLDKRAHQVWIGDEEISPPLSVSQYRLLEILYEHEGRVVPRKEVIAQIWGVDNAVEVSEQAFDALVRRLRDRLATLDPHHSYIVTVRGHGILLENPPL